MKAVGYTIVGLISLLLVAAVALPMFVDLNDYKDVIAAEVGAATGREVVIEGGIELSVLPAPRIAVGGIRLANLDGAAAPDMLRIKAAEVRFALLPLLRWELQIESLVLIEPVIELERLADGRVNWELPLPGEGGARRQVGDAEVRFDRLVVTDGVIVYRDGVRGVVERIEGLNVEAAADSLDGPFRARGALVIRGAPLGFQVSVGALDRRPIPIAVEVTSADAALSFTGSATRASVDAEITGKLKAQGPSLARLLAAVAPDAAPVAPLDALLAGEFSLAAVVAGSAAAIGVNNIAFELNGVQGTGAVNATFGESPRIDAAIALNHVDLDKLLARGPAPRKEASAAAEPFALPAGVFATLDLRIDAVVFNQAVVRQVQLVTALDQGVLTVQQASALLPGGSDVTVFGVLDGFEGKWRFSGQVEASADNLRAVLGWLEAPLPEIPADRLRKLSLSTKVEIVPGLAKISALDLRIDLSRLTGGINVGLGPRPAFNAIVNLDRINLDGYLPRAEPAQAADGKPPPATGGGVLGVLAAFDGEIKAQVGSLIYNTVPVTGLAIDAGLRRGVLTLRSLTVGDVLGAGGTIAGVVDTTAPDFDLTYNLQAADLGRLLRRANISPPAGNLGGAVARGRVKGDLTAVTLDTTVALADVEARFAGAISGLDGAPAVDATIAIEGDDLSKAAKRFGVEVPALAGQFALEGKVEGGVDAAKVSLTVTALGAEAKLDGTVEGLMSAPAYDLAVAASHPDFAALVERLTGDRSAAGRDLGEVRVSARVSGDAEQARVSDLDAAIGAMRLAGALTARFDGPRPAIDAELSAGDIVVDAFLAAPEAARGTGGAPTARWSREPIDFSGLSAFDATARVEADSLSFGKYRFEAVSLRLKLADGVLDIEELLGRLYGAPARVVARLADARPPRVDFALKLQGADLRALLVDAAGVDRVSGRAELSGAFRTQGYSAYELVSALSGQATVGVRDGVIEGIDLGRLNARLGELNSEADFVNLAGIALTSGATPIHSLEGTFTAERGVLRTNDLRIVLDGATGRTTGTIDLPRWQLALNSEFRLSGHRDAPPVGLLLMGPIDNPSREIRDQALRAYVMEKLIGAVVRKLAPKITDKLGAVGGILDAITGGGVAPRPEPQPQEAPAGEAPEPKPAQLFQNLLKGIIKGSGLGN
ncbi:MAG: AsmA family protein [Proteobacteria bacterium]|nr:AsmA family protein [Pseudomonadota bacterium]